ncbi:Bug family tripartite tricarboxylate transporter substrate binding protein [Pseudorhodoferax soli]|uniref:Tripartite-type tricarboxylate transporter receptor subunit TctC n=1 Tax=Pseudorhodoferax soli TaxID=545864 RepID=A0A368XQX4_9BURK|nr:tripartite tricarboxylate transporter substrate binding protein [Pseudorhodoferax soli]RCW69438.1 tripartite-type tricarboxylate transporter receptor subunit TctC [Pseudorhodoferax soli]
MHRRTFAAGAAAMLAAFTAGPVPAQEAWPQRPVRLLVGFTPGGSTDLAARIVAQALGERLGKPVVVENKPGASGNIATEFVAKSAPDGYTLMLCTIPTHAINPHLYKNLPYDHLRDFAPISLVAMLPNIVAVHPQLPARNLQELVALAKQEPAKYQFAAVPGGSPHLTAEVFKDTAGIQLQLVPYKGASPAITDVIAGHVPIVFENVAPTMAFIQSGKLRPIAVTSPSRLPGLESVPTVAESGYPGFAVEGWSGIVAPTGTPAAVLDRLNVEVRAVLAQPEVQARFVQLNLRARPSSRDEFGAFMREQTEFWGKLIARIGLKLD